MNHSDILKKKIIYKSEHRGCKENDLLLGKFTKQHINSLDPSELEILNDILDEADLDIFSWITNKTTPPPKKYIKLIQLIQKFIYSNK